jgi:hypothetical protein
MEDLVMAGTLVDTNDQPDALRAHDAQFNRTERRVDDTDKGRLNDYSPLTQFQQRNGHCRF